MAGVLREEIEESVRILLGRGWTPYDVLTKALVEGMRIVGVDFRDGILFVPEVLMSANAMKAGMTILRPLLAATGAPKMGKMVIGAVKGDIHDIGRNLVCMMMEGAGFEVFDIGINNGVEKYLEAIEKRQADVVIGHDANCAAWIRRYREPAPEGEAGTGNRREGGRRRARSAA